MNRFLITCLCGLVNLGAILPVTPLRASSPTEKPGEEIVLVAVKEGDIPTYDIAIEGFLEVLAREKIPVRLKVYNQQDKYLFNKIDAMKPAVILTLGSAATKLVHARIKDIPIVFAMVLDPVGSSVKALNVVGAAVDIPPKLQLETLKATVPSIKKIGIIYYPPENEAIVQEARAAAAELGIILSTYPIASEKDISNITDLPIDLLWIIPDSLVCNPAIVSRFIKDGLNNRQAVMGFTRNYAKAGALLGITCDYKDNGRQAAEMALKILRSENCRNLGISVPRTVNLYVNKTAADVLGIILPQTAIEKASEVF